jgi:hypothetical protein
MLCRSGERKGRMHVWVLHAMGVHSGMATAEHGSLSSVLPCCQVHPDDLTARLQTGRLLPEDT